MKKITLLYAEDEYITRRSHVVYLQSRYNFKIYEANDGEKALALYKKYKPDIVLTDISMPNMSGLELSKEIRLISKKTKIIILTAHSEKDKLLEALNMQMVDYLIKPIKRKDLENSINIAVELLTPNIVNNNIIYLDKRSQYNIETNEYHVDNKLIACTQSETQLLNLFCQNISKQFSAYDIFLHIWESNEKNYSATSIRTLIKNLRKKMPKGILINIYGGFYKLQI